MRRLVDEFKEAKIKALAAKKTVTEIEIEKERDSIIEKLAASPLVAQWANYRENADYFEAQGFDVESGFGFAGYKISIP